MEINEASVGFPGSEELAGFFVVGALAEAEMLLEFVPSADIVARENVQSAKSTKKRVFGGPAANAANGGEVFEGDSVIEFGERFDIKFVFSNSAAEFEKGALLLPG